MYESIDFVFWCIVDGELDFNTVTFNYYLN